MGCFLGCFGISKDEKKRTKNAQIPFHVNQDVQNQYIPVSTTPTLLANKEILKKPINSQVLDSCAKQEEKEESKSNNKNFCSVKQEEEGEQLKLTDKHSYSVKQEEKVELDSSNKDKTLEQLSLATRKKVTFASDVKEYKHVSFNWPPEIVEESEKGGEIEVEESKKRCEIEVVESEKGSDVEVDEVNSTKPTNSSSVSEDGSALSSLGSFPPNHRYGNCRESDDEDEELDSEVSDLDEDDDEEGVYDDEFSDDEYSSRQIQDFPLRTCSSVESTTKSPTTCLVDDGGSDHMLDHGSPESETKTPLIFNRGARDRAGYVHSVLNPVENTAQWKSVKVKGTPPMKEQKENFAMDLSFQQSSSKCKAEMDELQNNNEVGVHASLSTWLVSSEKTPSTKDTPIDLEAISSAASLSSHGSNSVKVQEERPILGALTVEELKQFSATSSPRRSPSRSPDERPLVGTVGVHWNDKTPADNTSSVSSFKGIPNTTSKYREDQRVNWHSTPFETRLERALNRGAVEGDANHRAC